ncbi:MAG: transcription-repair coupling factor Mfd, partial [Acidimicrobiaceae bacterium]|nr:transcription-repair coupling factor Mfd [Acidimicrobiaceae bacterium]
MTRDLAATSGPLAPLTRLAREEPALAELLGRDDATVAIPEAARPYLLAAAAGLGSSPLVLVATATALEAEHVAHDLRAFATGGRVEVLPAWDTLPFERISPGAETMGQRLRALWRIHEAHQAFSDVPSDGSRAEARSVSSSGTQLIVAPVRALLQRLGTSPEDVAPLVVRPGDRLGVDELVERLVHAGYRREYQVEHRGEVAVRGGIIDVFPSTSQQGVRIDCFGDEVDRLTEFDVADQRSVRDLDEVEIFGCRELVLSPRLRERAERLAGEVPFAREHFTRLAAGDVFDGVESFLPWLAEDDVLVTDLLQQGDRVVLLEPRRMRDRAVELVEEEAALAESLAGTWGAEGSDFPRLHADFDRLLARCPAKVANVLPAAEGPETLAVSATSWPAALGDASAIARRLGELARAGVAIAVCAESRASAER